jgi:hypothetical protein
MRTQRPRRGFHLVTGLVALVAAGLFVPSASAVSGELRVLYAFATWGPLPFTAADAERVAAETDAFIQASSSGRLSMPGSVAAPIRLPRAVFDSCDATVLRDASPPATFEGYDRIVFVTPPVPACRFAGEANPTEVLLNGLLFRALAAHDLGHTLGLGHASRWNCVGGSCEVDEYGGEYSVMGGGDGDFNAYEKARLEWLTGVTRPTGHATYDIGPIEGGTALPQTLVVTTAASEFWFESRGDPTRAFTGDSEQPPGVAVIAGPGNGAVTSPYPRENLLLANPGGRGRFAYAPGESFVLRGVFSVTVERHARESATLRFAWLDRIPPGRPAADVRRLRGGRVRLTWDPAVEEGSGVQTYSVVVDGRVVRTFDGQVPYLNSTVTLRLAPGPHRVAVLAIDRAGNRGRSTTHRLVISR